MHTITFDTLGGSSVSDKYTLNGYPVSQPSDPSKRGNIFLYWSEDISVLDPIAWDFSTLIEEDITLYVNWLPLMNIGSVTVTGVTAPATDAWQDNWPTNVTFNPSSSASWGSVSWSPNHNPFHPETQYTASLTLSAEYYYWFENTTAIINSGTAQVKLSSDGKSVVISYQFPATAARVLTGISINTQPSRLIYTEGDRLDLTGLSVRLNYDTGFSEIVQLGNFASRDITTVPVNNTVLDLGHNSALVVVQLGSLSATTAPLTVNSN
ncbi:MAG: InlB B-repeat-containing protein [Bacteroidales bacterium]|nr:InlB B-repeat-containing protein [Bacteroidales bacterium]